MKFVCEIRQQPGGKWQGRYKGNQIGPVEVNAESRQDVIEKLRGEIRYRLELCPCSGEADRGIEIEVLDGRPMVPNDE